VSENRNKWYKLDNVAKIVPCTEAGTDNRVFRLVCELKEEVDPEMLQQALDHTMQEFPHFNVYMKKGFFWYYLKESRERAAVYEDNLPACSEIYIPGRRNLLFRVNYYKKRINVEMYHALSDGTGAFEFLKAIVLRYLGAKYNLTDEQLEWSTASVREKKDDAFGRFYQKQKDQGLIPKVSSANTKAWHIRGERDENIKLHLLEGTLSVGSFLEKARAYHTTLAVLATSILIESIIKEMRMRDHRYPVVIAVPVNLRNYFPSNTTRNFFGVIDVIYHPENYKGSLEDIIPSVRKSFQEELTEEKIFQSMNSYSALENNIGIQMAPLIIKDLVVAGFNKSRKKEVTMTLSNVGKVNMPAAVTPYINKFASFMAAEDMQICISSFEDKLVFGVTSAFRNHEIMMHFFRRMTEMGIDVELSTSDFNTEPGTETRSTHDETGDGDAFHPQ